MKVTIDPEINEFYRVVQDEVVVTDSGNELRTSGLETCSALVITGGGATC
ncbi:MAG: hypothetical protein JKP92_06670 [Alphaproteobacteria bacterium]|jgi:hypothetical protein|nr:hypothetical protein [Alphaproteobacteria bacterium]